MICAQKSLQRSAFMKTVFSMMEINGKPLIPIAKCVPAKSMYLPTLFFSISNQFFLKVQIPKLEIYLFSIILFRGTTQCQPILCPTLSCANPVTPPGECCPTCSDTQQNSYCEYEGDERKHLAGTTWHPYIPPVGFYECVICSCPVSKLI